MELLENFFSIGKNKKIALISFAITCFVCFASYSAFIVNGFVCPDGILEGFHTYINRDWAIGGCGRWTLVLINMIHSNLVFYWLTVIECLITNWLSAHMINKIIGNENKYLYCISCAMFSVIPPIVASSVYTFQVFPYCLSIMLSILFVYLNIQGKFYLSLIASVSLGFAMGCYQAQIGVAVGLTIISIIKKIIENDEGIVKYFVLSIVSGLIGAVVYFLGLNICLKIFNLELTARAADFSIGLIFSHFFERFIEMYKVFFSIYLDTKLKRLYIYIILLIIIFIEIICLTIKMIKERKFLSLTIVLFLIFLLPAFFYIVGILLPNEKINFLLWVPGYVAIFFVIFLKDYLFFNYSRVIMGLMTFCLLFLTWSFILSANATFDSYRLSYNVYKDRFSSALDKVFELEDYKLNETRIIVIGYPDDNVLRENLNIYYYGEHLHFNFMYWGDTNLDPRVTYQYLLNEFGIDGGVMEYEEYHSFKHSDECKNMPAWPKQGYVQMIDDCAVIKFSDIYE